jgi:hypothetical protein
MALLIVSPVPLAFSVVGDNVSTVIAVDLGLSPFNLPSAILRVADLSVNGIAGLTVGRSFVGTVLTLTFSAPWVGIANIRGTVLI